MWFQLPLVAALVALSGTVGAPQAAPSVGPGPSAAGASDVIEEVVPPEEMIDFLGRRQLCHELREEGPPRTDDRARVMMEELERLECSGLPAEEKLLRSKFAADAAAIAWLNGDPATFKIGRIVAMLYHGPPPVRPHRIEQRGTDHRGEARYHLLVDTRAEGGRSTTVTAAYGDVPSRTITLSNERFPHIDARSISAAVETRAPRAGMRVTIRHGYLRGYCGFVEEDDRPKIALTFEATEVTGSYTDMTNCRAESVELRFRSPTGKQAASGYPALPTPPPPARRPAPPPVARPACAPTAPWPVRGSCGRHRCRSRSGPQPACRRRAGRRCRRTGRRSNR